MAQSQRMLEIVMQTDSTQKGICPSMTTHKDRQLDQNAMKSTKDLMISKKGVCPSMSLVRVDNYVEW